MPIPVLFMIEHLTDGGTESHFHDLVANLDRERFEPHVICCDKGLMAERLEALHHVRLTCLPVSRAYGVSGLRAVWKVRRYMRRYRIQAAVSFHFVADFVTTLAAWGRGLPVVISSRRDVGFTRNRRQLQVGALLDRGVDGYIAVSTAVREAVARDEKVAPDKISIVYNGCDIAALDAKGWDTAAERSALGISPEEVVVGCVANFNPVKGHANLIAAFARLVERQPSVRPRLLLAGDGPRRDAIEADIRAADLQDHVILRGYSEDVTREFQMSDIVVLASDTEGFSNAIVQGMVFRKPVVATAVGGNPEAIVEGETGLLVPPRDPVALADALVQLVADPDLRDRMGAAGRARAEREFSLARMMSRTEDLIAATIASRRV